MKKRIRQQKQQKTQEKIKMIISLLAGIDLLLAGFLSMPNLDSSFAKITTAQTENYTELYFENHQKLPAVVVPSHVYSFSFTIHNLENKDMNYSYEVYSQVGDNKFPINTGTIQLKNDEYRTVTNSFVLSHSFNKAEVVVNLINKDQQIDFLIGENNEEI